MTHEEMLKALYHFCNLNHCEECPLHTDEGGLCFEGNRQLTKQKYEMLIALNSSNIEKVNHPSHYQGKNECIDVMIALFGIDAVKGFCACNAYKYRFRSSKKNGEEDIKKAEWYESKLIELGGL